MNYIEFKSTIAAPLHLVPSREEPAHAFETLSPTGEEMTQEQWDDANAKCFGMLLDGRAQESDILRRGEDATVLLVYNAHFDVVNFTLPKVPEGAHWEGLVDTNQPDAPPSEFPFGAIYALTGRSFAAFGLATPAALRRKHPLT